MLIVRVGSGRGDQLSSVALVRTVTTVASRARANAVKLSSGTTARRAMTRAVRDSALAPMTIIELLIKAVTRVARAAVRHNSITGLAIFGAWMSKDCFIWM